MMLAAPTPSRASPLPQGVVFQALEILGGLRGINLVGMDVVEVAPAYDHADVTSLAAATLAMEMLCLYAARHKVDR
jgi:agmatinase